MGPQIPEAYRKKYQLEKKDSGVDGLILQEGGSSVAYQVKFRSAQAAPSYDELTSFWAESEHTDRGGASLQTAMHFRSSRRRRRTSSPFCATA